MAHAALQYQKKRSAKPIAKRTSGGKGRAAKTRRGAARKNAVKPVRKQQRHQQAAKPIKHRPKTKQVCSGDAHCKPSADSTPPRFTQLVDKIENKLVMLVFTRRSKATNLRKTTKGPLCDMLMVRKRAVGSRKLSKPALKTKPKLADKSKNLCVANKSSTNKSITNRNSNKSRQLTKMKIKPERTIEMGLNSEDAAINDAAYPQQNELSPMDN